MQTKLSVIRWMAWHILWNLYDFFPLPHACSFSGLMRKVAIVSKMEITCILNNRGFSSPKFTLLIPLPSALSTNSRDQNWPSSLRLGMRRFNKPSISAWMGQKFTKITFILDIDLSFLDNPADFIPHHCILYILFLSKKLPYGEKVRK